MKTLQHSFLRRRLVLVILFFSIVYVCSSQVQNSGTVNTGNVASAINFETQATGAYAFAAGYQSVAAGYASFALGTNSTAYGHHSFCIGDYCYSAGQGYSIGQNAKAMADQSYAFGKYVETYASGAITIGTSISGHSLLNNICNSLMIGFNSTVPTFFISDSEHNPWFNGIGKVGIGTSEPVARLQVSAGDIYIEDINRGIVMKSPDGNCWRGTLNNDGQLIFVKLADCITLNLNEAVNQNSNTSFSIYPNPATNIVKIQCPDTKIDKNYTASIYDPSGKKIICLPISTPLTTLNVINLKPGQYMLTIANTIDCLTEVLIVN